MADDVKILRLKSDIFDARYLLRSANLTDLDDISQSRTSLGLVAGGSGDIWVEKAGDTMTGNLNMLNDSNAVFGNSTTQGGQITMYGNASGANGTLKAGLTYAAAGEYGLITERLLLTSGRFDFDADGGKSEIRVAGGTTIFNIFNKDSSTNMFSADSGGVLLGGNGSQTSDERLSVIGNLNIKDADTATKQYRFRTSGGSLDFEGAGAGLVFSVWANADFTGTQYNYFHARNVGVMECLDNWEWKGGLFQGARHIISGDTSDVVFNEGAEDINVRIEGDTDVNLFYTDAGNDRVGIGTNAPAYKLDVAGEGRFQSLRANNSAGTNRGVFFESSGSARWDFVVNSTAESGSNSGSDFVINRYADDGSYIDTPFGGLRATGQMLFGNFNSGFDSSGNLGIGTGFSTPASELEVVGTIQADGLRLDVTPTSETVSPTHTITISVSGTDYKIPVVAA